MTNFNQAIKWMKEGKKVKRKGVQQIECYIWHIPNIDKGNRMLATIKQPNTLLILDDFEATDWEIYCEEHEWIFGHRLGCGGNTYACRKLGCNKGRCKHCGIEKSETELKTLKDFFDEQLLEERGFEPLRNELIQEAIKDIKQIQKLEDNPLNKAWERITGMKIRYSEEAKQGVINYIKWKFNITKEDLK